MEWGNLFLHLNVYTLNSPVDDDETGRSHKAKGI